MAECPSVCEHLHLPIQSGDDEMLQRMGRQYTVDHYRERLARIRAAVPGIAVSTDVIVGFCGETEAQFEATLAVLEELRFDTVFAAAYSPRPGTPALRMADDVPAAVKRRRLNELLARQESIGLERNREWLGRDVEVLVERITPRKPRPQPPATRTRRPMTPRSAYPASTARQGRGAWPWPAGPATTSSFTSPATRRWSGAR